MRKRIGGRRVKTNGSMEVTRTQGSSTILLEHPGLGMVLRSW